MRKLLVSWMVVVGLLPVAQASAQAGPFIDGAVEYTHGQSCSSIRAGNPQMQQFTGAFAGYEGSEAKVPKVGEVFYAAMHVFVVGDPCKGGADVLAEIVPPAGLEVAVDAQHLVHWDYLNTSDPELADPEVALIRGEGGRVVIGSNRKDGSQDWPLSLSSDLVIKVPVKATRAITGGVLKWSLNVADGSVESALTPFVGITVAGSKPVVTAPRSIKAAAARRGIPVTVTGVDPGATVTATLALRGGARVARATGKASAAGAVTLRPRVGRAAARRIRRAGDKVRLTVKLGAGSIVRTVRVT